MGGVLIVSHSFFFSSRRRHTRCYRDWSSDVCSSDLVLGIRTADRHALDAPDQLHQLETFANQTALAIERAQLADEAQEAQVRIETERLRSSLLSSVSHDLRTPLATITGAASTILENGSRLDAQTRQELLESVREAADRLSRLVQNLLELTRLQSGGL